VPKIVEYCAKNCIVLDEKVHKSGEKVHKFIANQVVEFCVIPCSMAEIADLISVKNLRRARERYVNPQLGKTLKCTIPDKSKSSKQKYVDINVDISNF
jgi:hypothetical protein